MSTDPFIDEKIKAMVEGNRAYQNERPRESPYAHKSGLEYANAAWLDGWDRGEYDSKHGIIHIAGAMTGGVQHCVVCGEILTDNRNAHYAIVSGEPAPTDRGWPQGPVLVVKSGMRTDYEVGEPKRVPYCKPL